MLFIMLVCQQTEDEKEMVSRTVYCTNIDKKVCESYLFDYTCVPVVVLKHACYDNLWKLEIIVLFLTAFVWYISLSDHFKWLKWT